MFEHSRILVPWHYIVIWRQNWKNCMLILDLCPLSAYLYIPCTSWYIPCFHIGKDKSVISCCRAVHWCLIMPAYILHAQHSLSCSQMWKKTSVQEINYVITAYNRISRYISSASCYILWYTTLYFESGWSRLANPFWLGSCRNSTLLGLRRFTSRLTHPVECFVFACTHSMNIRVYR